MSNELLFWVYLANAVILINHEIDSAYWQEWKLINANDKNGITGYLLMHFPLLFLILYGLVLINELKFSGYVVSLILGTSGVFAFIFHFYHLNRGRKEFSTLVSKAIIISTFIVSLFQIVLTIWLMML
jgi:hypothetical protein